jgi:hypothetical protein
LLRSRIDRLRGMAPLEMGHRVLRLARAHAQRFAGAAEVPAPQLCAGAKPWIRPDARVAPAAYVAAADRIAEGWLDVLALRDVDIGSPPRWNRDPRTGIEAPIEFGKLLDWRDADRVGDIRYLWQSNRHAHFVTLAQAYALTRREKYVQVMAEHLDSWLIACPFPLGANWASAAEAAIRLMNWSAAWQLLGGAQSPAFDRPSQAELRARWLRSVYQHAEFTRGWLSLHSGGSELIVEGAGLFIAALTWPHWPRARLWLAEGKDILEREALAQNTPEGVNREQALASQELVLETLLLCLLAAKAGGQRFSPGYESRIEAMLDFIASIMDAGGHVPMHGDSDAGEALRLVPARVDFSPCRSLLATGAILFKRGDFKVKAGALDDRTRWLLGPSAGGRFEALDSEKTRLPLRQQFPEGGWYILGAEFDGPNEIRLLADAGPLGSGSNAARGHADALSFTLSVAGREFLIDPGASACHTQARWRQYFRGSAAHNTVRVDGLDQSEQADGFLWRQRARAGCSLWLSSAQKDSFEGWHDGYMRLPDPVKHRRLIEIDKKARRVLVEDTLEMEEDHAVELFFHCGERCSVDAVPGGYLVSQEGISITIRLPQAEGATSELYLGSVAPIFGWISRAFDSRQPAPTIAWRVRLAGRAVLRTEIAVPSFS